MFTLSVFAPTLVVKSWKLTPEPEGADGAYVEIHARRQGLIAWLLSHLGVDPTVDLTIDSAFARLQEASWGGRTVASIPLGAVSSFRYGVERPWAAAMLIALPGGYILSSALGLVVSYDMQVGASVFGWLLAIAIGVAYYLLNKTMTLTLRHGVVVTWLRIKRSVIEGQSIDEKAGQRIAEVVETLIDSRR